MTKPSRKIIRLTLVPADAGQAVACLSPRIIALCDDGAIFQSFLYPEIDRVRWHRLENVPQPTESK